MVRKFGNAGGQRVPPMLRMPVLQCALGKPLLCISCHCCNWVQRCLVLCASFSCRFLFPSANIANSPVHCATRLSSKAIATLLLTPEGWGTNAQIEAPGKSGGSLLPASAAGGADSPSAIPASVADGMLARGGEEHDCAPEAALKHCRMCCLFCLFRGGPKAKPPA